MNVHSGLFKLYVDFSHSSLPLKPTIHTPSTHTPFRLLFTRCLIVLPCILTPPRPTFPASI